MLVKESSTFSWKRWHLSFVIPQLWPPNILDLIRVDYGKTYLNYASDFKQRLIDTRAHIT